MFVVHKLGQHVSQPKKPHLEAVYHLLQYLKGVPGQRLLFSKTSSLQNCAFSDVNWGSYLDSRRSITGSCVFIGDSLVSWKAKK